MRPLLYLELRQFINSIKNTARTPKRLIPALIFAAWVFAWIMQSALYITGAGGRPLHHGGPMLSAIAAMHPEMLKAAVFMLLSIGSMAVIYQAFASGTLIFSIAHIDFLFPTPISRRTVLLVKLLKDYLKYGFWVALMFTFIGGPVMMALNVRLFPLGLVSISALTAFLLFVVNVAHTVNLVFTFGFERLKQAGIVIKTILGVGLASAVLYGINQYARTGDSYVSILWAANSPVVKTVFAPADWCATLLLAPLRDVVSEDWIHLFFLWMLAGLSFAVLMSRNENIYEPSLGVSVKFDKRRQAMRSGDYSGVRIEAMKEKGAKAYGMFGIPPFGKGAVALLWKNLLAKYRVSRNQMLLMMVLPAAVVYILERFVPSAAVLRNIPFALLYITFVLSMTAQPELRTELKHANILKCMPIAGWKIMFVQVLSAAIYLSAGVFAFAIYMWIMISDARGDLLLTCALGAPSIGFACVSAAIIPSLLYPDMRDAAQNYICNLLGFMLISVSIIPTIVLGILLPIIAGVPYWITLAIITLANLVVGAAGVTIAGAVFRKFDPTGE